MNFFRDNPGFMRKLAVIGFEYLGFIEIEDNRYDDETYRKAHAILESIWRTLLMVIIIAVESLIASFIFG
jgi:hypothetical protein